MDDLVNNTDLIMYHTNIKRFIDLIETNDVLKFLLLPFAQLDISSIEVDDDGWIELNIPVSMDYQIAFIIKKYKEFSKIDNEYCIHDFLYRVYKQSSGKYNADEWNKSIVTPCFRDIIFRLNDMLEDIPSGREMNTEYMNIINVENITNTNSNFILGNDNIQNNNQKDIYDKLIKLVE